MKDIGIEDGGKTQHCDRTRQLKLQTQFFRQLGQVLQGLLGFLLLLGLVAAQLFEFDAAVSVDLAAFQAVRFDFLDDERARHIEEVGRFLRGQGSRNCKSAGFKWLSLRA